MEQKRAPMTLKDRWLYWTVRAFFRTIGSLPAQMRNLSAVIIGRFLFAVAGQRRRITMKNLSSALGREKTAQEIRLIARRVFENLCHVMFEIGWAMQLDERHFQQYFSLSGVQIYRDALSRGKGVLLLTGHFGNWELSPIIAHMTQMPIRIVYRAMDNPALDLFFKENRSRFGGVPVPTQRGAMQKIFRALRQGFPVGMLMDQGADWYDGVFVDFFNRPAATNNGMAILAIKSQAPVVPLFLIRRPGGFQAVFGPELPLIKTGDYTKDIEENTRQYNRVIEAYARKYPDQWFWIHQRWKNRPYCAWPRQTRSDRRNRKHLGHNTVEIQ